MSACRFFTGTLPGEFDEFDAGVGQVAGNQERSWWSIH
jgi:hypothetical protein